MLEQFDHSAGKPGMGTDAKSITGPQLRAARSHVGVTGEELAAITRLALATIRRAEQDGTAKMTYANAERLMQALEALGVVFLARDETGGPGVRLVR